MTRPCAFSRGCAPTPRTPAPEPILRNAVLLTNLHRFDECEALLDATEPRFRDNPDFAVERAWVAHHRRDFAAALGRWESMRERFLYDRRVPSLAGQFAFGIRHEEMAPAVVGCFADA